MLQPSPFCTIRCQTFVALFTFQIPIGRGLPYKSDRDKLFGCFELRNPYRLVFTGDGVEVEVVVGVERALPT